MIGRAGLRLGGTQLGSVERAARALIEAEPYRESGYVLLMQALQAQGNIAEALRVFERLRRLLRDELGTAPSPDAIAAHAELLHPDGIGGSRTPLTASDAGDPEAAPIPLPVELRARAAPSMIGRVAELAELERWLAARGPEAAQRARPAAQRRSGGRQDAAAGRGRDPGPRRRNTGARRARPGGDAGALPALPGGARPLRGRGLDRGAARRPRASTAPSWPGCCPSCAAGCPSCRPPAAGDSETERYRLFEAVAGLLGEVSARRPVLIVLDDLHWADRPTLMLLRHLARARQTARLSIIGAYRATERWSEGFAAALAGLRHERLVKQIEMPGCPSATPAALVAARVGRPPSRGVHPRPPRRDRGQPVLHRGDPAPPRRTPGVAAARGRGRPICCGSGCPRTSAR